MTASFTRSLPPLLLLALAMTTGWMAMGSFAIVQEAAKAELRLSDYDLSVIQGVGAAVPLVLFSVPVGIVVDRFNRVRLLIALSAAWTAGTLLTAWAGGVVTLTLARMLTGIGATGAVTAALSLGADWCAPAERGRAMLVISLGKALGMALGFAAAGWLLGLFLHGAQALADAPWRRVHVALGIASALLTLPLLLLREPTRREVAAGEHPPFRVVAAELWARRAFLLPLFVGQTSVVMADVAAGVWAAPVLSRSYGLRPEEVAGWLGALLFVAGVGGAVVGGLAADAGQKGGKRGGVVIGAVVAAAVGAPAALFSIAPDPRWFAIGLGVLVLAGAMTGVVASVALTVLVPNELRGLTIGAFISIAGLIGYGVAPALVVWVSGLLGGETHLGTALAIVGIGVGVLSVAAFVQARRKAPLGVKPI